jgi:hypothetical protein
LFAQLGKLGILKEKAERKDRRKDHFVAWSGGEEKKPMADTENVSLAAEEVRRAATGYI